MLAVPRKNMTRTLLGQTKSNIILYLLEETNLLTPTLTDHNGIFLFLLLSNSLAVDTESAGLQCIALIFQSS